MMVDRARDPLSVDAEWRSYWRSVKPERPAGNQESECRRAFHAGAWSILRIVERLGDSGDDGRSAFETLLRLDRELRRFLRRVGKDR